VQLWAVAEFALTHLQSPFPSVHIYLTEQVLCKVLDVKFPHNHYTRLLQDVLLWQSPDNHSTILQSGIKTLTSYQVVTTLSQPC